MGRLIAAGYVLVVQAVALALVTLVICTTPPPRPAELTTFGMLAATAGAVIVTTTVSINVRRQVRRNPWTLHIAYLATGILTLPPNLLVLLLLIGIVNYLDRSTLSIANHAVQHDFGVGLAAMWLLLSVFSWAYAFGQLPAGGLLDRFGPRRVLGGGLLLWSLAQ